MAPTGIWDRFRTGLGRTRERLQRHLAPLVGLRGEVSPEARLELEDALLSADVGPATVERLIEDAERAMRREAGLDLRAALERAAVEILGARRAAFEPGLERPWVALLVGVNGVGKTTLAGKLAAHLAQQGHATLLVAADTFRAAATEQLEAWARRAGAQIVRARDGADPAAVVHDALEAARGREMEVVLIDTAGRLHTKHNLMAELEKMSRVCGRQVPGAPHHVLLVLDATLGQNGLQQAREFQRVVRIDSLAVTKLDGTARGGAVLAVAAELGLPISLVSLGEGLQDWEAFDSEAFARGLFQP